MEGTQEAQKPKLTIQDLEGAIEMYKGFEAKAKELPQYVQMALLPALIECMPEAMRPYCMQMLGVKYAQAAHEAVKADKLGDAAGYATLAGHYLEKTGIKTKEGATSFYDMLKKIYQKGGE